jgi:broad specificity phosphatase PhoE
METLILVRHSLPKLNPSVPANEWSLSDEGRTRARTLGFRLADYRPELIFTSPEPKAAETAEIVGRELGLAALVLPGLHEHERGNIGWVSREVLDAGVADFFRFPDRKVFGGESADQAYARFSAVVEGVLPVPDIGTAAIVAHGTVICLYLSRVAQVDPFPLWKRLGLPSFVVIAAAKRQMIRVVEQV